MGRGAKRPRRVPHDRRSPRTIRPCTPPGWISLSQDARTAACRIEWSAGAARATDLAVGVDDAAIVALAGGVAKLGIDVPLGWPTAFVEAIVGHSRSGAWPASYAHADTRAVRYRRTDLVTWERLGAAPLSVSTDRIALPAMRAAALVSRLGRREPLDGSGLVVEAYPAAALTRWGFPSRGYKRTANAPTRAELVSAFISRTSAWLELSADQQALCRASDDAFDAVLAALVARASACALVEPIAEEDRDLARREGWIVLPETGSLDLLPEACPAARRR